MFVLNIPKNYNQNKSQTTSSQPKIEQVIVPVKPETKGLSIKSPKYDRSSSLLNYLQSLLKWTYKENPEFSRYLEEDELVTWYVHNMQHPQWFKEELETDGFHLIADMTDYVRQHKDDAELYDIVDKVHCNVAEVNN